MELEREIDRLYGVPLDEFVTDRDELARRLRKRGERQAAERVKKLRKPTAGAWALNQAVRRRRKETDALLKAGERLREAHEELMAGGDPAALREAMRDERSLAGALADCAEAIASETGKSGPALRERVRSTLHAASVDEEAREELARGRFAREREAVGLGPFEGAMSAAPAKPRRSARAGTAAKPARGAKGGRGAKAKAEASAAERKRAEREAAAEQAAAERERAARVEEAERALGEAEDALERARSEHADAVEQLESAREAVRSAEEAERAARKAAREQERETAKRERELERLRAKRS